MALSHDKKQKHLWKDKLTYTVENTTDQGSSESRKTRDKKFKSALLIPTVSTNAFHSTNLFLFFSLQ